MSNRSPRYPAIDLGEAVRMAIAIFDKEGRAPVKEEVAVTRMGYGGLHGASQKALSALRKYGLVEDVAGGVKVSQDTIIIAAHRNEPQNSQRVAALRKAAFRVELFADLYKDFGGAPSEENLAAQLTIRGFSTDGALKAARAYRATMELVGGLGESYSTSVELEDSPPVPTQGQPMEAARPDIPPAAVTVPQAVASGEREWIRGPLARDVSYRLIVSGDLGPRELGKLIKVLEAQKAILEDDDIDD